MSAPAAAATGQRLQAAEPAWAECKGSTGSPSLRLVPEHSIRLNWAESVFGFTIAEREREPGQLASPRAAGPVPAVDLS